MQLWQFQKQCWNRFKKYNRQNTYLYIILVLCYSDDVFVFYWILISILPYFPFSSWFTKISSTQTRHRFFLPMLQTTNFLLSCLFWHMWYNCPKHPSPQKSTSETKKQYLNHCTSTPYWKSSRTCSSPRHPLFLHALSFECTSKLCINVLNRFSVYFHI